MNWPVLLLIWLILAGPVTAQDPAESEYVVDAWQTEDGLPQNTVKAIVQTRDGYLWLGTFDGLVRFDGFQFAVFTVGNTPELRSGDVSALFQDRSGRLWIGTDGEGLFTHQLQKFSQFTRNQAEKVTGIAETPNDTLIVTTTTGAFRLQNDQWEALKLPESEAAPTIDSDVEQNERGEVWLSRRNQLYSVTDMGVELRHTFSASIGAMLVEADGTVRCGLNDGHWVDLIPGEQPRLSYFGDHIFHAIRRTRRGDLWVATQKGLIRVRNGTQLHLTQEHGLISNDVEEIYEDREQNLWIGTNGGGLNRLREKVVRVHSTANGLLSNDCTSLIQDRDGRIWVSSFKGGVQIYDHERWTQFPLPPQGRSKPDIAALLLSRSGQIWIGGYFYPHHRWNGHQLEEVSFYGLEAVRVLFEDRAGGIWIGSRDGGVDYRRGSAARRFDITTGLTRNMVTAIAEDSEGNIWVGTNGGLNRLSPDGHRSYFQRDGLGADGIYALYVDADNTLWIGTAGGGLSRFKDGEFRTMTKQHGLPSEVIGQLIEDDLENLWMGTTVGIVRAKKKELHDLLDGRSRLASFDLFGKGEGLIAVESNNGFQPSVLKTQDGQLWFCTIGGVVVVDPKQIVRNPIPPPIKIEQLVLDHHTVLPEPISDQELRTITVPAGTSRLELHFTALSFVSASKVRFRYLLDGYDSAWTDTASRIAHYTRIPAGHYEFRVLAANNDGVWNTTPAVLGLIVEPFYWQTAGFRIMAGLALISAISAAFWVRFSHLRRVHAVRLRIAQDLHDEAGSNLGSIQLLSRRAAKQAPTVSELSEIHRITTATAESIRNVVWLIDPEFDSIDQMLKAMESVAARTLSDLTCDVQWEVTHTERSLSLEFRSHFFLMFKEILHNVQKHAQATRVSIYMTDSHGWLILTVQDDGIGFDPAAQTAGRGLKNLQLRTRELNGHLQIDSQPGQGTTITLRVKPT